MKDKSLLWFYNHYFWISITLAGLFPTSLIITNTFFRESRLLFVFGSSFTVMCLLLLFPIAFMIKCLIIDKWIMECPHTYNELSRAIWWAKKLPINKRTTWQDLEWYSEHYRYDEEIGAVYLMMILINVFYYNCGYPIKTAGKYIDQHRKIYHIINHVW